MNNKNNNNIQTRPSFNLIPYNNNNGYGWTFSGFSHADASFSIIFNMTKTAVNIAFKFSINLGLTSSALVKEFKHYFGCGNITNNAQTSQFYVTDFKQLWHIIIPHFIKFPMHGSKFVSFLIFTYCMSLCYPYYGVSNPIDVILEVLKFSYFMNEGTRRTLEDYYNLLNEIINIYNLNISNFNIIPYDKGNFDIINWNPLFLELQHYINTFYVIPLDFIVGLLEGDGSFIIKFRKNELYAFMCKITTSIKDIGVLYAIQRRLNCGYIYSSNNFCKMEINKIEDLNNKIIPLIDSLELYRGKGKNLLCSKSITYAMWREGIKKHLNKEISREKSIKIKTTANKIQRTETINFIKKAYNVFEEGKKRKLTLSEFLQLHDLKD